MKSVFPQEIINVSVESHFARFSKKSYLLYITILLFIVGSILALFIIKTEITIQSRGVFRASTESVEIIAPVIAKVNKTKLSENKWVEKGDTLVWLDHKKQDDRISYLNQHILENVSFITDLEAMLNYKYSGLETNLYKAVHTQYRQKLIDYDLEIALFQNSYDRTKKLFDKKVIPATEIEQEQFQLEKIKEEKKNFVRENRNEWHGQIVKYQQLNSNYKSEIESLKNDIKNYTILAPKSGHIANFSGIHAGSYVSIGQSIAMISPFDIILAEHLVPPKDIGYLRRSMPVIFQIDAYNYHQWGLATGTIMDISNEIYLVNNQPYFKVRSSIDQTHLVLKNGYKGELKKGLTVTARFLVTERSVAQLIFDKTDNWLNPKLISE